MDYTVNKYPIYIISKGRADTRFTSRSLEAMNTPYRIVIEESEYDDYAAVIDPKKILTLPKGFREDPRYAKRCEVTGYLGGSIPVRNWVWEHSKSEGHAKHWVLDDNLRYFFRFNNNRRRRVTTGAIFRAAEDFTDRYENVKLAGLNYCMFVIPTKISLLETPYYLNSRIYSCILISNDLDVRWRGKYNEDTDLSLRVLKQGWCTMLFNTFLCGKITTMTMKGGNTEDIYNAGADQEYDDRYTFAKSLKDQHPDVVEITKRFQRTHHLVDYTSFKQKPIYKEGIVPVYEDNEYGMVFREPTEEEKKKEESYWKKK